MQLQRILPVAMLTFSLVTVAYGGTITGSRGSRAGTITGSRTGTITGSRTGTITGSRTGTITGSRTGTITGSRVGAFASPGTTLDAVQEELVSRIIILFFNLGW